MKSNYFQFIQHITFNNNQQNMKQNSKNVIQNPNFLMLYANPFFQLHLTAHFETQN